MCFELARAMARRVPTRVFLFGSRAATRASTIWSARVLRKPVSLIAACASTRSRRRFSASCVPRKSCMSINRTRSWGRWRSCGRFLVGGSSLRTWAGTDMVSTGLRTSSPSSTGICTSASSAAGTPGTRRCPPLIRFLAERTSIPSALRVSQPNGASSVRRSNPASQGIELPGRSDGARCAPRHRWAPMASRWTLRPALGEAC